MEVIVGMTMGGMMGGKRRMGMDMGIGSQGWKQRVQAVIVREGGRTRSGAMNRIGGMDTGMGTDMDIRPRVMRPSTRGAMDMDTGVRHWWYGNKERAEDTQRMDISTKGRRGIGCDR